MSSVFKKTITMSCERSVYQSFFLMPLKSHFHIRAALVKRSLFHVIVLMSSRDIKCSECSLSLTFDYSNHTTTPQSNQFLTLLRLQFLTLSPFLLGNMRLHPVFNMREREKLVAAVTGVSVVLVWAFQREMSEDTCSCCPGFHLALWRPPSVRLYGWFLKSEEEEKEPTLW